MRIGREILEAARAGDMEGVNDILSGEGLGRRRPHESREEPRVRDGRKRIVAGPPVKKNEKKEKEEQEPMKTTEPKSPFTAALVAARKITTHEPKEEQPVELEALKRAMAILGEDDQRSMVFRLVNEVLEDRTPLQCIFPVARIAGISSIAHSTAAIKRAIREGGLLFGDLQAAGLVAVKINPATEKPYSVYFVGHSALVKAEDYFRHNDKSQAAEVLAVHIRRGERNRALAAAIKNATAQDHAQEPAKDKELVPAS